MEIRILGAHNLETAETKLTSILVDSCLAIDAGGLTSSLSLTKPARLQAIFLTHHHFDHIRDIATFGLATRDELVQFLKLKGYLPRVVLVHPPPIGEEEVADEASSVAKELKTSIVLAKEGMILRL